MDTKTYRSCSTGFPLAAIALLLFLGGGSVKSVSAQQLRAPGTYIAYADYLFTTGNQFIGISGNVSAESPKVVRQKDYVFAGLALFSASPLNPTNFSVLINVGYMVNPTRNGDARPRLFVQYLNVAPNGIVTGCIDTDCPGFVKTETKGIIGSVLRPPSMLDLKILQDKRTKNWVIYLRGMELGFYPDRLFTGRGTRGINAAAVGGATVDSTNDSTPRSQMGSGVQGILGPVLNVQVASVKDVSLVEASGNKINLNENTLATVTSIPFSTNPTCYTLSLVPKIGRLTSSSVFYYGGSGCLT